MRLFLPLIAFFACLAGLPADAKPPSKTEIVDLMERLCSAPARHFITKWSNNRCNLEMVFFHGGVRYTVSFGALQENKPEQYSLLIYYRKAGTTDQKSLAAVEDKGADGSVEYGDNGKLKHFYAAGYFPGKPEEGAEYKAFFQSDYEKALGAIGAYLDAKK